MEWVLSLRLKREEDKIGFQKKGTYITVNWTGRKHMKNVVYYNKGLEEYIRKGLLVVY
jgi:hypothetical protein